MRRHLVVASFAESFHCSGSCTKLLVFKPVENMVSIHTFLDIEVNADYSDVPADGSGAQSCIRR
jgi:hypothetical protein